MLALNSVLDYKIVWNL